MFSLLIFSKKKKKKKKKELGTDWEFGNGIEETEYILFQINCSWSKAAEAELWRYSSLTSNKVDKKFPKTFEIFESETKLVIVSSKGREE